MLRAQIPRKIPLKLPLPRCADKDSVVSLIKADFLTESSEDKMGNTSIGCTNAILIPLIPEQARLALLTGFSIDTLHAISNASFHFYKTFFIRKKNGTPREIEAPLPDLKKIQRWILHEILEKTPVSEHAKAYLKNRSIKDNARFHEAQPMVVKLDIKDFFPSIGFYDVYNVFSRLGYCKPVCTMLANLCCFEGHLPQGAPTSPQLSNLVMKKADDLLSAYAGQKGLQYTRYADDLTFSGDIQLTQLLQYVKKVLKNHGFMLNQDKTRIIRANARQLVTGIVVNQKMQLPRNLRRHIRQQVYYIQKFGFHSHARRIHQKSEHYLRHLLGCVSHAQFVNPYDKEMKEYNDFLKKL